MGKVAIVYVRLQPGKTVRPGRAGRPDVWPPKEQGSDDGSLRWIVIEITGAVDLVLDRPLHGKTSLVGKGLRIRSAKARGIRVGARGKVSNLDIGVMNFQIAV